MNSSQIF